MFTMEEPHQTTQAIEHHGCLPAGSEERFLGYGVLGQPFASGHLLCLRRFPHTSIGPGYTSVWHRSPEGCWTFIQDAPPHQACSRYFGRAIDRIVTRDVALRWTGPREFTVQVDGGRGLHWEVSLSQTPATQALNQAARRLPVACWRHPGMLKLMGRLGGALPGAGGLTLTGRTPNGQRFASHPREVWAVAASRAFVCGADIGPPGSLPQQARLGDLRLPQQGRFFIGEARLEPLDRRRHYTAGVRLAGSRFNCLDCI